MKTENGVPNPAKGDGSEKVLELKDVQHLLKRDLQACLLMLQALHDDQDVLDLLAVSLHGKYLNAKHKEELAKQTELAV